MAVGTVGQGYPSRPYALTARKGKRIIYQNVPYFSNSITEIYHYTEECLDFGKYECKVGWSPNDKIKKDEQAPSIEGASSRAIRKGLPPPEESIFSIETAEWRQEMIRIAQVQAQTNAHRMYCKGRGINPNRLSVEDTEIFFTSYKQAGKINIPPAMPAQQTAPTIITIGTDCSGMDAPIKALQKLHVEFQHKFSCENDKEAVKTIMANFKPEIMESDIRDRDMKSTPYVDIYVAGFPCQPFSVQ